jgi:hypothetical protein
LIQKHEGQNSSDIKPPGTVVKNGQSKIFVRKIINKTNSPVKAQLEEKIQSNELKTEIN